jgi:5-methylcytosine-specific restriction endonuclease McrA
MRSGNIVGKFCKICRRELCKYWAKEIKKYDNFECILCGSIENLEVHHIVPFFNVVKRTGICLSRINTYNWRKNVKKVCIAHKITDGITLCHSCHKFLHGQ